jgi:hypothetical protein
MTGEQCYPLWGWLSDPCRLFPAAGLWSSDETDEDWPSGFVFAPVGVELQDSASRLHAPEGERAVQPDREALDRGSCS